MGKKIILKPDGNIFFSAEQEFVTFALNQGFGNTTPDLSDLVPFHSEQVRNLKKVNTTLYFILNSSSEAS